ncbi:MAG: cytochrome o ubiquinol oxidase subunit IV [Legionellales bacterium]
MKHDATHHADYGTGDKKLSTYLIGFIGCSILTLLAFWTVMSQHFSRKEAFIIILAAAGLQFLLQVIFFLRLTTQTEQGKTNIMTFIFTGVVLVTIISGSLWIMWNLDYNMMH